MLQDVAADPSYVGAWKRYRQWARLRFVAFVGYVPFGAAAYHVYEAAHVPSLAPLDLAESACATLRALCAAQVGDERPGPLMFLA
jgi:hypothetical protein